MSKPDNFEIEELDIDDVFGDDNDDGISIVSMADSDSTDSNEMEAYVDITLDYLRDTNKKLRELENVVKSITESKKYENAKKTNKEVEEELYSTRNAKEIKSLMEATEKLIQNYKNSIVDIQGNLYNFVTIKSNIMSNAPKNNIIMNRLEQILKSCETGNPKTGETAGYITMKGIEKLVFEMKSLISELETSLNKTIFIKSSEINNSLNRTDNIVALRQMNLDNIEAVYFIRKVKDFINTDYMIIEAQLAKRFDELRNFSKSITLMLPKKSAKMFVLKPNEDTKSVRDALMNTNLSEGVLVPLFYRNKGIVVTYSSQSLEDYFIQNRNLLVDYLNSSTATAINKTLFDALSTTLPFTENAVEEKEPEPPMYTNEEIKDLITSDIMKKYVTTHEDKNKKEVKLISPGRTMLLSEITTIKSDIDPDKATEEIDEIFKNNKADIIDKYMIFMKPRISQLEKRIEKLKNMAASENMQKNVIDLNEVLDLNDLIKLMEQYKLKSGKSEVVYKNFLRWAKTDSYTFKDFINNAIIFDLETANKVVDYTTTSFKQRMEMVVNMFNNLKEHTLSEYSIKDKDIFIENLHERYFSRTNKEESIKFLDNFVTLLEMMILNLYEAKKINTPIPTTFVVEKYIEKFLKYSNESENPQRLLLPLNKGIGKPVIDSDNEYFQDVIQYLNNDDTPKIISFIRKRRLPKQIIEVLDKPEFEKANIFINLYITSIFPLLLDNQIVTDFINYTQFLEDILTSGKSVEEIEKTIMENTITRLSSIGTINEEVPEINIMEIINSNTELTVYNLVKSTLEINSNFISTVFKVIFNKVFSDKLLEVLEVETFEDIDKVMDLSFKVNFKQPTIQIPDDLKKNLTIVKALLKPIRSDIYINVIMQKINSMYKRIDNSVEILPITVTTSLDETERNLIQELSINLKNLNDAQDRELIFAPYVSNRYEQRMNQIEELSNKAQALRRKYIPEKFDLDSKSKLNTKSKMLKSNYLYRKYLETNDNKYLKEIDLNLIDAELLIAENVESGSKGHYNKYKIIEDFDIDEYLTQDEIAVMDTVDLIFYLETIEKENPLITTFLNDLPASMINYIYGFEVKLEKRQAEAMNTTSRFKVYKPSK